MSATATAPFLDTSNLTATADASQSVSTPRNGKRAPCYSLYPDTRSSVATTSDQSSIYNASIAHASGDENSVHAAKAPDREPDAWFGGWMKGKRLETSLQAEPSSVVPASSPAPDTHAIVEARFRNNPNGTALTTIIERRSSLSLRQTLSKISKKRSFTPVHIDPASSYCHVTHLPPGAQEVSSTLSLDEAAIREYRGIVRKDSSQGSSSIGAPVHEEDVRPHAPVQPPFKRTDTPPGRPRWPGDMKLGEPSPRGSSLGFRRALRNLVVPACSQMPQLPATEGQRWRTARLPSRIGQAYWRPPRSAHSNTNFSGTRHPFYNAPLAKPVTSAKVDWASSLAKQASKAAPSPAADTTSSEIGSSITRPPSELVETTAALDWSRTDALMAAIAEDLDHSPTPSNGEPAERARISTTNVSSTGSPFMTILPVRESSINCRSRLLSTLPSCDLTCRPLSPRDDQCSRYTAEGVPIYRPEAPKGGTADDRRDSVHEPEHHGLPAVKVTASRGTMADHVHWAESTAASQAHMAPHSHLPSVYRAHISSPAEHDISAPRPEPSSSMPSQSKRIVSAALPVLLPIAAREGIVRPVRLVPHHEDDSTRTHAPSADAQYDERIHNALYRAHSMHAVDNGSHLVNRPTPRCGHKIHSTPAKRCWRCGVERSVHWVLDKCFCQPTDAGDATEMERVRVVASRSY